MKIPKTFLPERNLEKKVKDLSKEGYKRIYSKNPSFTEISEKIAPILENFAKTVYGKESQYHPQLERLPDPYKGWIDFFDTNYKSERYYCTMFDLQSEEGIELRKKFANSQRYHGVYDFKPHDSFEVKGKLVSRGYANGFKWYILRTDKKGN